MQLVEDIYPVTLKCFLKYIYTGTFELSSIENKDLFKAADKYQVETPMELIDFSLLLNYRFDLYANVYLNI